MPERAELLDGDDQAGRRADLRELLDRDEHHQRAGARAAVLPRRTAGRGARARGRARPCPTGTRPTCRSRPRAAQRARARACARGRGSRAARRSAGHRPRRSLFLAPEELEDAFQRFAHLVCAAASPQGLRTHRSARLHACVQGGEPPEISLTRRARGSLSWKTASTLLPSGSRTKPRSSPGGISAHRGGPLSR